MDSTKKGFWRGFTWKIFFIQSLLWFSITLTVEIIFDAIDPKGVIIDNLTTISLIKRIIGSIIIGFLFTLWYEPMAAKSKH